MAIIYRPSEHYRRGKEVDMTNEWILSEEWDLSTPSRLFFNAIFGDFMLRIIALSTRQAVLRREERR